MPYMWGRALVALESEEVNNGNSYDGSYGGSAQRWRSGVGQESGSF